MHNGIKLVIPGLGLQRAQELNISQINEPPGSAKDPASKTKEMEEDTQS